MPILTLQKQARELGRIRIGQKTSKGAPTKLDRFRLTCASRALLDQVAAAYGGEVKPWTPAGGAAQWEVVTDAARLPVLVPPQPVSQWFEVWSGGGCQRRCDGEREVLTDVPCLCGPDPDERECKPTTRLNVILRDVPGLGVWRLESHGYYAAVELPEVARFLAETKGYVAAALILEERTVKRQGQPIRRFMVPALEVENVTPAQLMAGTGVADNPAAVGAGERAALPAGPSTQDVQGWVDTADAAVTLEQLTELLRAAREAGLAADLGNVDDPVSAAFVRARDRLAAAPSGAAALPPASLDDLWFKVLSLAPEGWTTEQVEGDFVRVTGVRPGAASAEDMDRYLAATAST